MTNILFSGGNKIRKEARRANGIGTAFKRKVKCGKLCRARVTTDWEKGTGKQIVKIVGDYRTKDTEIL